MEDDRYFSKLMNPRSIAVIGASAKKGSIGRIIFDGLIGAHRKLFPIHPWEKEILGHPVIARAEDLPDGVDLAVIAVNAEETVKTAFACAAKKIPFIIIASAGFGETGAGGAALENKLKDIPKRFGSRILGPNSLGIFIPSERLDTIFVEHGDKALSKGGGVAFISQSGSVGVEALGLASNMGYGMRAFIGLGNKCDLNEFDFLKYFAQDPDTRCLAFYLESIENNLLFLQEARKVTEKKPVVVLKAGRTPGGIHAVASHTGRLAGSDQVIGGVFKQYGIQRVMDDEELCDASKCLSSLPLPMGNRVAVLTGAGGYGVMCVDYIETVQRGIELKMAALNPETIEAIQRQTFPYASCRNPVDLTALADDRMFGRSLDALLADDGVDIIICTAFFSPPTVTDGLVHEIAVRADTGKKPIIVFSQYGPYTDLYLRRFHDAGVVGFPSIARAVRAARFLVERAQILNSMKCQEGQ